MNKYLKYIVFTPLFLIGCGEVDEAKDGANSYVPTKDVSEPVQDETVNAQVYYKMDEISKHNTPEDCWTVVDTVVADVTDFFGKHPGGDENLAKSCGIDASEIFNAIEKHDPEGKKQVMSMRIGFYTE